MALSFWLKYKTRRNIMWAFITNLMTVLRFIKAWNWIKDKLKK